MKEENTVKYHKRIELASCFLGAVFIVSISLFFMTRQAQAVEGGISHYIPGTYGDFLMGYIPESGFYIRNDSLFQSTSLQGAVMGGKAYGRLDDQLFLNLTKLTWMFDVPALKGYVGFGLGLPLIANEHITGSLAATGKRSGMQESGGGNRGGLSDIYVMPIALAWALGDCHILVSPIIYLPTGYYNPDKITNLGLNYTSFDENIAFTWLDKHGFEISFNVGYMINTKNETAQYQSGNEFHFDWTAAYHPNMQWSIGAVGYLYAQTTPDTGSGATFGSYMSSAAGLGPAIGYTVPVAGKDVSFIAKWIHDTGGIHRLHGDTFCLSFSFKL